VSDDRSFHGSVRSGGPKDGRRAALVIALVIAFVGLAIVKPWGSTVAPTPTSGLPTAVATAPVASTSATAPVVSSLAPSFILSPLPVAFTTPLPTASATWTGLDWQRLAPDDALSLVTSVVRWRHGFVAVGQSNGSSSTPVWTSADGEHWDPLPFNTSTTFWPGQNVLVVIALPTGLVALTGTMQPCADPCPLTFQPAVAPWTSPDSRTWTPRVLPQAWLATPPLATAGPAGLVMASSGASARLAISTDGANWQDLPASAFPAAFWINDLQGTGTGYVAVGRWMTGTALPAAASLWSADGRHWSRTPTLLSPAPAPDAILGSTVGTLVTGRDGMIAVGRGVTSPGGALWWQSADGRRWRPMPTFPPLGTTRCPDDGCSVHANGALVSDGRRMVAVRGGVGAGAWTSTGGLTWRRLRLTGDLPGAEATQAVLLPGGILLSDGTTTWFGRATGP
jgi:hypothetical protein